MTFEVTKLKYNEIPGLSEKLLKEHHDVLYAGYVNKLNEIRDRLNKTELSTANATFSEIRELKLEEGFTLNAVRLHELYFANMGGNDNIPSKATKLFETRFGSMNNWREELVACGLSARGWVVLSQDKEGELNHYICDMHNQGGIWQEKPIIVLDVYEHAYFTDYGTNRKAYLDTFINNIDWQVVEKRLS